jgi:hypothetical protein
MTLRTLLVLACFTTPTLPACGPSCEPAGESLRVTKAEVYGALAPDAGSVPSGCPTSQELSTFVAVRYRESIDPSRIGPPREDGASCEYPIADTLCN